MRRYDEVIDVRRGLVSGEEAPTQFLWRDRLWVVRDIIAHWVETGAWWEQPGVGVLFGGADPSDQSTSSRAPRSAHVDSHRSGRPGAPTCWARARSGGSRQRARCRCRRVRPVVRLGTTGSGGSSAASTRRAASLMDPFVHLHVASGYSLKYGASHPHELVAAGCRGRDGRAGAHRPRRRLRRGALRQGLHARRHPADPRRRPGPRAVRPDSPAVPRRPRTAGSVAQLAGAGRQLPRPGRGALPRVTLLAGSKAGWAALCRLVSATHLRGERGVPVTTRELVAEHWPGSARATTCSCCSGRRSELGAGGDACGATTWPRAVLRGWRERHRPRPTWWSRWCRTAQPAMGRVEPARRPDGGGRLPRPVIEVVLTNAVRYADRSDAPTVDILDAVRRLVPLDLRHLDRANAEGFLKSGKEMADIADEICRFAGLGERDSRPAAGPDPSRRRPVRARPARRPRPRRGAPSRARRRDRRAQEPVSAGDAVLRERCEAGDRPALPRPTSTAVASSRLDDELAVIGQLGYASYFLTVADVVDLIRDMGVRAAARGSGAGSLVNYLLGISGVDPIRYGLLMERFLSPLRQALPDIDIDVESARRTEVYERILDRYTGTRCACVSMMDTYRVRHAIRDVGAALGMPPGEIDSIAKAFPHIRAKDARTALRELPELRASGLGEERLDVLFELVERLDGLPRHIAVHPCGVLLSDATLLDRTPVEASYLGLPDEPVRQGRRRGPRPAQARRARHPDAVGDGARDRRDQAGRRRRDRHRRRGRRRRATTRRRSR